MNTRRVSIAILQIAIVLLGMATLAFMLWEPHLEGRNAHATVSEIYFNDPFLAYAYFASISFYVILYQAFKVLGCIAQQQAFSNTAIQSLRIIRYSAIILLGFVAIGEIIIALNHGSDDAAGGLFMGMLVAFGSVVTASGAWVFQQILQEGLALKEKNETY